jgi:hypothetical protein
MSSTAHSNQRTKDDPDHDFLGKDEPATASTEHTPTPWHQGSSMHGDRKHMIFAEGYALCICEPDQRDRASAGERALQEANAAFIVKAVNLHGELVSALEKYVSWWDRNPDAKAGGIAIADARAALAKAGAA